ncbi:Spy/CpxP family protein refolding chaperone [Candidatus Nitrospira allomarina]|uniref:Periplasmic heavy metal sensor n=1 Tax=Candidatus Nitrospira allomarina TaxID=3020900 RepID=A0AA96GA92_9BACT|nr:periplasmic heavy metal sensor [Candidatus Nitrospira allomarina]WNM57816.1 periplasmic heavy metal sensor [Candidatus Nitrospira allomarina]
MQGFKHFMVVVGMVTLVIGGTGPLVEANPGSAHDPHGKQPHAGMGYAESDHEGMEHHGGLSPLDMKEELGLSEEQVTRLLPLELDYRKTMIQNGADLRVAMVDMGTLMDAKQADMAAIPRKVDEISQLQKNMMMYRVGVYLKVKEVLSPVQYEQFRSRIREHMEGMAIRGGQMTEGKNPHAEYSEKSHGHGGGIEKNHP